MYLNLVMYMCVCIIYIYVNDQEENHFWVLEYKPISSFL